MGGKEMRSADWKKGFRELLVESRSRNWFAQLPLRKDEWWLCSDDAITSGPFSLFDGQRTTRPWPVCRRGPFAKRNVTPSIIRQNISSIVSNVSWTSGWLGERELVLVILLFTCWWSCKESRKLQLFKWSSCLESSPASYQVIGKLLRCSQLSLDVPESVI